MEEDPVILSLSSPFPPSPPGSTFLVAVVDADDDSDEEDDDLLSSVDLNDGVVYLRLVVEAENLLSVTAMEVPVDLPGEKVIVSGMVGLLVVERADSKELSDVLVFIIEELVHDESDGIDDELCSLTLNEEVKNDDEVTVIGVVVGIEGINDRLDVKTSDELVLLSAEDEIELLSLTDELVEVVTSSVRVEVDDRPVLDEE